MAPFPDGQHMQDQRAPAVAQHRHHLARGIGAADAMGGHIGGQRAQPAAQMRGKIIRIDHAFSPAARFDGGHKKVPSSAAPPPD
jgi:hypothetical protein